MKSKISLIFPILILTCIAAVPSVRAASPSTDAERELLRLINKERARKGTQPLEMDERLTEAARVHSEEMAQRKQLSHRFPNEARLQDRLSKTGVPFDAVAENVAHSSSAANAHIELMNSSGHRANILDPKYNAVGVGVIERDNHLYITQDFARRLPTYTSGDIERRVFSAFNSARKQKRQAPVTRVNESRLRDFACEQDVTASRAMRRFGDASSVVVFTGANPEDLPDYMEKMAGQSFVRSIAVGACAPSSTRSSYATFTVVALFYR
jgi:hypothetical protein